MIFSSLGPFHDIDQLLDIPIAVEHTQMIDKNFDSTNISSVSMTNDDDGEFEWED